MGNFNRGGGNKFSGRDSDRGGFRGGNRGGGFRDRNEEREMFQATCTECGKSCEVPFRPTGNKPVLCRDCFRAARSDDRGGRDSGGRDFSHRHFGSRGEDQSRSGNIGGRGSEHFDQQFIQLNEKLDRILKRLTPSYMREQTEPADGEVDVSEEKPEEKSTKKKAIKKDKRSKA
ncbi:MAG: hypothetical protein ACD_41C00385G0013 [uncultured bacterium]|nr:MAG: hypothetical protein ACD_41C00385G0013 [uncultured bacterium]